MGTCTWTVWVAADGKSRNPFQSHRAKEGDAGALATAATKIFTNLEKLLYAQNLMKRFKANKFS